MRRLRNPKGGIRVTRRHRRGSVRSSLFAVAIATILAPHAAAAPPPDAPSRPYDQFIVKFKDGSDAHRDAAARRGLLELVGRAVGLRLVERRRLAIGADVIQVDEKLDPQRAKALIARLRNDPRVEFAEPDRVFFPAFTPDDPEYPKQWHYFDPIGGINLPRAWEYSSGGFVAVLDSGTTVHSDLETYPGYDFITDASSARDGNGRDADPADNGDWISVDNECGNGWAARASWWHGTWVAGIVGARSNNGKGVAGASSGRGAGNIVPVRVFGHCGGTSSDAADAITWASGGTVAGAPANVYPAPVLNLSFGGVGECPATMQAAIDDAVARGALVVAAAGNGNFDVVGFWPANCNNVLTVGASTVQGGRAWYSNYGAGIDLMAPGGAAGGYITSTSNDGATTPTGEGYSSRIGGTSAAAPHVSAVAAMVTQAAFGKGVTYSPSALEALLKASTRPMPVACPEGCGSGLLDAAAALDAVYDKPLVILKEAPALAEGAGGSNHAASFVLELTEPRVTDTTLSVSTWSASSTATAGSDYVARTADVVIPAGQTSATFAVSVIGDDASEGDEVVAARVDPGSNPDLQFAYVIATHRIVDDDMGLLVPFVPHAGIDDPVAGHDRYFRMQVPAGARNLQFMLSEESGDADLYVRYGALPTQDQFDCRPFLYQSPETCEMGSQAGTWYVMVDAFAPYTGVSVMGAYELPSVSISSSGVTETNDGSLRIMSFTVLLSNVTNIPVTFDIATVDGTATAGSDYGAIHLVGAQIPAGQSAKGFTVIVQGDNAIEANEKFDVYLDNVQGASVQKAHGVGTILNDDGPVLSIADASVAEGNAGTKQLNFTVSLSQASGSPVTFNVATGNGTASIGADYVAKALAGQSIPAGQLAKVFSVTINGDTALEPNETFTANLGNASTSIIDGQAIGTILNDEGPVLSVNDVGVLEGNSGTKNLAFTVSLSQAASAPVSFDFWTAYASATGADFTAQNLDAQSIPAGATSKVFLVPIKGDTAVEANELFLVNLTNGSVSLADAQGRGTILNDDGPTLRILDASVSEGNAGTKQLVFTVQLSQAHGEAVTFNLATANGTATAGSDYVARTLADAIPAGQLAKTFAVTINGDAAVEANETFTVSLGGASVSVTDGQAVGTIANDD
jgi:serine protease